MKDAQRVQLLAGDEAVRSGAINLPHPYKNGIAESWISDHESAFIKGQSLILAITLKETNILIGSLGIYMNTNNHNAELGYWIGKDYWSNGYCSEAVFEIVRFAFENFKLNKIFANFLSRNPASGKVLIKCGFRNEGLLKQHLKYNDKFEDIECYAILKSEYEKKSKE